MRYSTTTLGKSYIFTKSWAWEKCPNIGGHIKRVAQGFGGGKKLCPSLHYIKFQKSQKKPKKQTKKTQNKCTPCQA